MPLYPPESLPPPDVSFISALPLMIRAVSPAQAIVLPFRFSSTVLPDGTTTLSERSTSFTMVIFELSLCPSISVPAASMAAWRVAKLSVPPSSYSTVARSPKPFSSGSEGSGSLSSDFEASPFSEGSASDVFPGTAAASVCVPLSAPFVRPSANTFDGTAIASASNTASTRFQQCFITFLHRAGFPIFLSSF